MEQLRQQQLELAKAPVHATVPEPAPEEILAPTLSPETNEEAPAPAEEAPPATEDGEAQRTGPEAAKVEALETEKIEEEAAADRQPVTERDLEESRKRKQSMRDNAEQVLWRRISIVWTEVVTKRRIRRRSTFGAVEGVE